MKRLFTLSAICVAMLSLVGCGGNNYETRARHWVCDHFDHYACLDKERHALYSFHEDISTGRVFLKVDLETMEETKIWDVKDNDGVTYSLDYGVEGYIIPEDKGYNNENSSFVIVGNDRNFESNGQKFAHIYDTYTQRTKKICQGDFVRVHGNIISCCVTSGIRNSAITSVDVYDAEGNKLTPKSYQGSIAKQGVIVELVEKDGNLAGSYYYTKYGPANRIYIYGAIDNDREFEIEGFNSNGYNCEDWSGKIENGVITGEFHNTYNGRSYDFTLTEMLPAVAAQ